MACDGVESGHVNLDPEAAEQCAICGRSSDVKMGMTLQGFVGNVA
jgi:hypothetical protein